MSLENIKNRIHQGINELVDTAVLDEKTGDMEAYKAKLATLARVADALGIDTEVSEVTFNIKS